MNNYQELWDSMIINPSPYVLSAAKKILSGKEHYDEIIKGTKIPWYFIGALHYRESSCDFKTHLHNGDPLTGRTIHVPKGRPIGNPPFKWEQSAKDALFYMANLDKVENWDITNLLYRAELYNGMGYTKRGLNSPYLWNYTNHYIKGKFDSDGHYNPTLIDKQIGVAPIIRYLTDKTLNLV